MIKLAALLCAMLLGTALEPNRTPVLLQAATAPPPTPPEAIAMTNPFKPNPEAQKHARQIYGYDCALCHGEKGDGKGDVGGKYKLRDWTAVDSLKDKTDGELYYTIKNGNGVMPGEAGRGKDEDLWNLVVLVRSFGKCTVTC